MRAFTVCVPHYMTRSAPSRLVCIAMSSTACKTNHNISDVGRWTGGCPSANTIGGRQNRVIRSGISTWPGREKDTILCVVYRSGMLRIVGEATQQLEKEVQATVSSVVATNMQQTQALIGTVRGEL